MPGKDHMNRPLKPDCYYHIYNRANGYGRLFFRAENYQYFLEKFGEYSNGFWTTLAYCLLANHFHFLVRIHSCDVVIEQARQLEIQPNGIFLAHINRHFSGTIEEQQIRTGNTFYTETLARNDLATTVFASWVIKEQLRRFFLGYSKAINHEQGRHGSLFQKPFRRKEIPEADVPNLVLYTHMNPVRHGYSTSIEDYPWSSYASAERNTDRKEGHILKELYRHFGGKHEYLLAHRMGHSVNN